MKYSIEVDGYGNVDLVCKGRWPKTKLAALKESIRKWEFVVAVLSKVGEPDATFPVPLGVASCALCKVYFDRGCDGCPVKERTGLDECRETPYKSRPTLAQAMAEVTFLKSLLPGAPQPETVRFPL